MDLNWLAIRALVAVRLATDVQGLPRDPDRFRLGGRRELAGLVAATVKKPVA